MYFLKIIVVIFTYIIADLYPALLLTQAEVEFELNSYVNQKLLAAFYTDVFHFLMGEQ